MDLFEGKKYQVCSLENDEEVLTGFYIGYDADCDTYQFDTEDSDKYECITQEDLDECYTVLLG